MEEQKIESLPLYGRNPMGLANLVPTVRGIGYFGGPTLSTWRSSAVSIGGGSALHNDFMVDGIATTKVGGSGAQVYPTIESTQEFKILTNSMSAEFGRTAGGVVSVITRSGTAHLSVMDDFIDWWHDCSSFVTLDNDRSEFETDGYRVNGALDDGTPFDADDDSSSCGSSLPLWTPPA